MEPEENLESGPATPGNGASGHSTGPVTAAGKAVSSMNRLTHGCRSAQIILHSEDPAEYAALVQGWLHQYNPQNSAERILVEQTAHAQWYLQRNQRRFDEVDHHKNLLFHTWTESQHKEYALAHRYKTSAERAFLRWFKELESYYARVQRNQRLTAKAETEKQAAERKIAEKRARAERQPARPTEKPPAPYPDHHAASLYQSPDSPASHERSP
jgi:hypothetical protein